jgi:hypothetical protein
MNDPRDHVISVVLSDAEWKAFVSLQPQPVAWLRQRIAEAITGATSGSPQTPPAEGYRTSARSH